MLYFVYDLDDDDNNNNNHEAFASTLRSDSVATLDTRQWSHCRPIHFILFRLPDGPAASASSHKQQHQVRVLIDAITHQVTQQVEASPEGGTGSASVGH